MTVFLDSYETPIVRTDLKDSSGKIMTGAIRNNKNNL